jgi:HSP20 family protein
MIRALTPIRERLPRPVARFEREMEELMGRLFRPEEGWWTGMEGLVPTTNMIETENEFEVTVELPGLKPEEFHVEVKNGELWITGEKKEETEEKGKTFHRLERRYGEFTRVLPLPATVNEEKVEAKFEGGVLTVRVPKTEEARPRHVPVEVKA